MLKEIDKKLRLGGLPLTVDNLKYGAKTMITPGNYKNLNEKLAFEKREKILEIKR